jgi:MFS family permease
MAAKPVDHEIAADAPRAASEESPLLSTSSEDAAAADNRRSQLLRTILAFSLSMFMGSFEITVVAAINPSIGGHFKMLNQVSWVATAYSLARTSTQPLYGRLADIFGRKQSLLFANVILIISLVGSSVAPSLWCLVAARALGGIGGGGLTVVPSIIISDSIPLRQRGIYQGVASVIWASGFALGGPIGKSYAVVVSRADLQAASWLIAGAGECHSQPRFRSWSFPP